MKVLVCVRIEFKSRLAAYRRGTGSPSLDPVVASPRRADPRQLVKRVASSQPDVLHGITDEQFFRRKQIFVKRKVSSFSFVVFFLLSNNVCDQLGSYFCRFQLQKIENALPRIWAFFKNAYCGTEWYRLCFGLRGNLKMHKTRNSVPYGSVRGGSFRRKLPYGKGGGSLYTFRRAIGK